MELEAIVGDIPTIMIGLLLKMVNDFDDFGGTPIVRIHHILVSWLSISRDY